MIEPLFAALTVSLLVNVLFFSFAFYFKTDKVTDFSYGASFILAALVVVLGNEQKGYLHYLLLAMISAWGIRLSIYLVIRILRTGKDKRFDGIRENLKRFASFWILQAVSVWIILIPSIYVLSKPQAEVGVLQVAGFLLWASGFAIEFVADQQKFIFKSKNPDGFIASGLWKYSRHPNYFGEALLWWGIFVFSLPSLSAWEYLVVVGPLFISYLLLFVSGIPPLERSYDKKYSNNEKYKNYKKRTSVFVPFFPRN